MIFVFHILFGLLIAYKMENLAIACFLALLSHYLLDFVPHMEYLVPNIEKKDWKNSKKDFLKIIIDLLLGAVLITTVQYLTNINYLNIILVLFFAVLPDILIFLNFIFSEKKFLKYHSKFHKIIHFPKDKKISKIWRILIQTAAAIILVLAFAT